MTTRCLCLATVAAALCVAVSYGQQVPSENLAVMELAGNGVSVTDLAGLSNRLRMELFNTGRFKVIERSRMEDILKEQGFQRTGCTNTECAVEVGQLVGVRKIVVGSIDKVAETYSVNIRMVDVATGQIHADVAADCDACGLAEVLKTTLRNAARKLAGLEAATPTAAGQPQPVAAVAAAAVPAPKLAVVNGVFMSNGVRVNSRQAANTIRDDPRACPDAATLARSCIRQQKASALVSGLAAFIVAGTVVNGVLKGNRAATVVGASVGGTLVIIGLTSSNSKKKTARAVELYNYCPAPASPAASPEPSAPVKRQGYRGR